MSINIDKWISDNSFELDDQGACVDVADLRKLLESHAIVPLNPNDEMLFAMAEQEKNHDYDYMRERYLAVINLVSIQPTNDSVKHVVNPTPLLKGLKWKWRESGDTELVLRGEVLAVVSYESRGWYWYSMCKELRLNTLRTNTTFNDMESAQAHCKQHISAALSTLRSGN